MGKLWKKSSPNGDRELADKVEEFTVGKDYQLDQELIPYDVRASKVHAEGLEKIGIIDAEELDQLKQALDQLQQDWEQGAFQITRSDEDGHTAIENYLVAELGELGKKIHTGRSRNDQVLTMMRLYERDEITAIWRDAYRLGTQFLSFAEEYKNLPMPGYTHTQRAMLSTVGLWSASYGERVVMALEYLPGLYRNINRCPLGSAAGYGVNFDLPRDYVSQRLDFDIPLIASMTAQHTRGRVEAELLSGLRPLADLLAQFSHDLIWYTSREYDFFEVADELCTGSSIMPQKKNFDTAEIMRGKLGEFDGYVKQLQSVTRNLTSGYHRDLQLTKEPVMRGLTIIRDMLGMGIQMVKNIRPKSSNLRKACTPELFAADKANERVKQGMSFRDAYREVANNLDQLKEVNLEDNIKSKSHLGGPGNPGIERIRQELEKLNTNKHL